MPSRRATRMIVLVALAAAGPASSVATRAQAAPPTTAKAGPPTLEVAWRQSLPTAGAAWLSTGREAVFFATAESGLTAFAQTDGRTLWSSNVTPSAPPAPAGEVIGVLSSGTLAAFDQRTGRETWRTEHSLGGTDGVSLRAAGSLLIAARGNEVRAWAADGTPAWRHTLEGAPVTRMVTGDAVVVVGLETSALVALDARTGAPRWRQTLPSAPTSLSIDSGRLFLTTTNGWLYALREADGGRAWRYRMVAGIGDATADDRLVYFTLIDNSVHALDRDGGSQRWSRQVKARPAAGPLLHRDELWVPLSSGQVVQLSTVGGRVIGGEAAPSPRVRVAATASSPDGVVFSVVVAGDASRELRAWRLPSAGPRPPG